MRRALLALALVAPIALQAQNVSVRPGTPGRGAALIDSLLTNPSVPWVSLRGDGRIDLPRDTVVTTSLLIVGRPTYVASTVRGDVVVIGADLFLRPGVDIAGRAVAIGGTVSQTSLGRVGGAVVSLPDETFDMSSAGSGFVLTRRSLRAEADEEEKIPIFQLGGIYGLGMPKYDRVNGLSLPAVGVVTLAGGGLELEPSITYRSRLGVLDPGVAVRVGDTAGVQFLGRVARDTRTNEGWIYRDLINSVLSFFVGNDARNYFRSDLAEGRVFADMGSVRPFVGGRFERVSPITGAGNVFSVLRRHSLEHMARPNPLVADDDIGSVLAGAEFVSKAGTIETLLRAEAEQSVHTEHGSSFTQLTVHGTASFPTVRNQSLHFRAHGVVTRGDSVPSARYAYLGGSGTLPLLDLLEFGGTELLFVESRYVIPLDMVVLPVIGSPVVTLRHLIGGAGIGSLGEFQQEVGVGVGLSALRLDYMVGAGGRTGHDFGVGISLGF